jgi:hypothetical protein
VFKKLLLAWFQNTREADKFSALQRKQQATGLKKKNMFTPHIPLCAPHTYDFVVVIL